MIQPGVLTLGIERPRRRALKGSNNPMSSFFSHLVKIYRFGNAPCMASRLIQFNIALVVCFRLLPTLLLDDAVAFNYGQASLPVR